MAKKPRSSIGFDPLAWMKNSSVESGVNGLEKKTSKTDSATPHSAPRTPHSPCVIALGDALNIADVSGCHAEWKRLVDGAAAIEIDASGVQSIDTAGLQLLAALVRETQARNLSLRWRAPSQALRDGVARLGLGSALRLP